MPQEYYAVLDIGKTLAKISLWTKEGDCRLVETRMNQILTNGEYQMLDVLGIDEWLAASLKKFAQFGPIEAIYPIAHGAAVAILNDGKLAFEPIDYEWRFSGEVEAEYAVLRGSFDETGSPHMENGLNMGIQLYYLKSRHPERFNEKTQIVPWAQYWAWRLSGIACTEVSSLGAHTDLWSLQSNKYSKMAQESGVAQYFAPMRRAGEAIGVLSEYWRQRTGLDCSPKIYAGIHDSNAALFLTRIAMAEKTQEFTIVSTGTWFVSMRATLAQISTEELADCSGVLFNVDIDSNKVPTALFMGGREIEILLNDSGSRIDLPENQEKQLAAVNSVVEIGAFILPTATPGIGPFGENNLHKINAPKCENQYGALVAIYAALVTAHGLKTIKSSSTIIIEGRFAKSVVYCRALASLLPNCSVYCCNEEANIALGALKLMVDELNLSRKMTYVKPLDLDLIQYQNRFYSHLKDTTLQKDKQS